VVKGPDNEFYLAYGFDREPNVAGAIFMDSRNIGDGSDRHTLLYGHRMRDGSMFRDLDKYGEAAFFDANREFELQTLHGTFRYRVFSAYVTTTEFLFIKTRFEANEFQKFLTKNKSRNMHADSSDPAGHAGG
jgi:sortase B